MRHVFIALVVFLIAGLPLRAQEPPAAAPPGDAATPGIRHRAGPPPPALVAVMQAVRADEWETARAIARPAGQVVEDIVTWRFLRADKGDFDQVRDFLTRNAGWPALDQVRARGEATLPAGADPQTVVDFFADAPPATGSGSVRLTRAFAALGRSGDAQAQAVLTWRTMALSAPDHAYLLDHYGPLLAPHHEARLDALLWQNATDSARLMLDLVPRGWRALAVARMALRAQDPGVDALIAAVPADLARDAGLAWERFNWRIEKNRGDDAIALLDERSISVESLGRPDRWANWRRIFARRMMRDGQSELAYRLAANHFLTEGADYADLEWLAGYVALRQLGEPELALAHFRRLGAAVETPISLGRAGYWEGRALEALGRASEAQVAFARGGRHQTSFYGQLAAERAGLPMDPALTGATDGPGSQGQTFDDRSTLQAALLFAQAGERPLAGWFLSHLAEGMEPADQARLADLALELDEPYLALRVAKVAAEQGTILPRAYFPVPPITTSQNTVPRELVLSIARRESEFNPAAASGAGALGLMQLMPATAQSMAERMDLAFSDDTLLTDATYNATLGAAYLARLIEEFGPNPVLVAVAYNAGPSRARAWISDRGDPRSAGVNVVDWIEMIPFRETRNYVMRVTESLAVYRARLDRQTHRLRLSEDLRGF